MSMLIKDRAVRITLLLLYCTVLLYWLTTLQGLRPVQVGVATIVLLVCLYNLYIEYRLYQKNTYAFLTNSKFYNILLPLLFFTAIIISTQSYERNNIGLVFLLGLNGFLYKERDLLFVGENDYSRKDFFGLISVKWTEITNIDEEGTILSISSSKDFLQIDFSKMTLNEKVELEKQIERHYPYRNIG